MRKYLYKPTISRYWINNSLYMPSQLMSWANHMNVLVPFIWTKNATNDRIMGHVHTICILRRFLGSSTPTKTGYHRKLLTTVARGVVISYGSKYYLSMHGSCYHLCFCPFDKKLSSLIGLWNAFLFNSLRQSLAGEPNWRNMRVQRLKQKTAKSKEPFFNWKNKKHLGK